MRRLLIWALLVVFMLGALQALSHHEAYGANPEFADRYDLLSSSLAGATATNLVGFTISDTSQPVGSVEMQFCEESPLPGDACTTPTGFNASAVTLDNQTGNTGFSLASNSTINTVILTRSPSTPNTNPNTYELGNIVNPSGAQAYYLRLYIYPTTDASGAYTQYGGVALVTTNAITVNSIVPPYLKFCAGLTITNNDCSTADSYNINFGDFSTAQPSTATSQFTTATNAGSGYNVYITGSSLTAGNNVIPNLGSPQPSLDGASQFGVNLIANSSPAIGSNVTGPGTGGQVTANYDIPNRFTYNNGDTIATSASVSDNQTFTVSYLANISNAQPAGVYATTLTYICLANF
ncbi:MAG TPA: hypothetical protein VMR95_02225 [Candidatus Binatia bacterium]|nr:hypothetical protein [Candidatus Binatia bacterium]